MAGGAPRHRRNPRDERRIREAAPPLAAARHDAARLPILGAFLLSGFAGLMHQVVWAKLLVQLIGATAHAQAAVLAVFMGGLAIGAVVLGRWVDRHGRPLRTYVWLELAIGLYCLLLPLLLSVAGAGYVLLARELFESAGLRLLLRAVLAVMIVLLPAVLMGGTLPVLARRLVGRVEDTQRQVANLYALNSFGAVLGAGVAGFVTLPALGVHGSLGLASLLNVVAGLWVLPLARREAPLQAPAAPAVRGAPTAAAYTPSQYRATLAALALSGFAAMGYEVLFTRVIALAFGSSTYSFTVMLMAFITGIALGSAVVARLDVRQPLWWLAASQVGVVVALLAVTPLVSRLPYLVGLLRIQLHGAPLGFELDLVAKAGLLLATLLLPTTCLGCAFPLVARIQARSPADIGTRVGSTYAWNTIGNVLGVVITGLVLIPNLGLPGAFHVTLGLNGLAAALLLAVAVEVPAARRLGLAAAASAAVVLYVAAGTEWSDPIRYAVRHLRMVTGPTADLSAAERARHPSTSFAAWQAEYVERPRDPAGYFFDEDAHATVLALAEDGETYLNVNGKPDASSFGDMVTQLLLAHAPLVLVPDARAVLIIGYGSGVTAGAALRHPLERVDVVEISRAVLDADRLFADVNGAPRADPRLHVYEDDGQSFLAATPRLYDVVISEPSNPWIAGIGNLFTAEFFATVRDHLTPHGVFTFWLHTYEQSDANVAMMVRTLDSVFPHALWFADDIFGNIIAVASPNPIGLDFDGIERRYQRVRGDLARIDVPSLAAFLAYQRFTAEGLRAAVGPGPVNSMGHPRLEYAAPRALFELQQSHLLDRIDPLLQGHPADGTLLIDRYLAHRARSGRPVNAAELDQAAGYFEAFEAQGLKVGASLRTRAPASTSDP